VAANLLPSIAVGTAVSSTDFVLYIHELY